MVNNPLSSEEMHAIMQTFYERDDVELAPSERAAYCENYQFDFFENVLED